MFQWELTSCGVAQSDRDKLIRKKGCQVLCNDRFDKVFWETKHSKLEFFYFAALYSWKRRKQCHQCSIFLNWFTSKRQNWVFALIYDRVKVLRGHTPYNKVGIIFFIWVRPHWKSLTKTYLNLNTIELLEQLPTLNAMLYVLQVKNKVSRLTFHDAVFSILPQNIRKPLKRDQWHGMG